MGQVAPVLREDLKAVAGNADLELVGGWLLGLIHETDASDGNLSPLLRAARHIVNATALSELLCSRLESVECELELAELGLHGTVAEVRFSLDELLAEFRPPPFRDGWTDVIFEENG